MTTQGPYAYCNAPYPGLAENNLPFPQGAPTTAATTTIPASCAIPFQLQQPLMAKDICPKEAPSFSTAPAAPLNAPQSQMCVETTATTATATMTMTEMETEEEEENGSSGKVITMMVEKEMGDAYSPYCEMVEEKEEEYEFKFREESVFLRRAYNYAKLPQSFLVAAMGRAVEGLSLSERVRALGEMALVARGWHQAARSVPLMAPAVTDALSACGAEVRAMQIDVRRAIEPHAARPAPTTVVVGKGDGVERLKMLDETLERVRKYLGAQLTAAYWRSVRNPLLTYVLLRGLLKELRTAAEAVTHYTRGGNGNNSLSLNLNGNSGNGTEGGGEGGKGCISAGSFDIVEMSVRRLVHELEAMVPLAEAYDRRGVRHPDTTPDPRVRDVIRDPDARTAWELGVGATRCYVDLRTFMHRVLFRDFPCARANPRFQRFVAYHLNTPVSDVVTVYRFRTLVSEFGPYPRFAENFDRYALRPGFVGLMNLVRAEEVLAQHYRETPRSRRRNTVLIRYSRSKPDVLAFSALDVAQRRISHRRNIHKDGTPIPISIFVEQYYAGYDLLPMGISDAAAACKETHALITQHTPYYYYVGPSEVLASYKYVD